MGIISGIVVFLMVWWVTLFAVLPWGIRKNEEFQVGNVASAPDKPLLFKKFLATTLITCIIWVIIYALISYNVVDFYGMAEDLAKQDNLKQTQIEELK